MSRYSEEGAGNRGDGIKLCSGEGRTLHLSSNEVAIWRRNRGLGSCITRDHNIIFWLLEGDIVTSQETMECCKSDFIDTVTYCAYRGTVPGIKTVEFLLLAFFD